MKSECTLQELDLLWLFKLKGMECKDEESKQGQGIVSIGGGGHSGRHAAGAVFAYAV